MLRLFPITLIVALLALHSQAGELVLCDLGQVDFKAQKSTVKVVETLDKAVLDIQAAAAKGYPGVSIPAPNTGWDLSAYGAVAATVTNTGDTDVQVALRVDNAGDWRQEPWSVIQASIPTGKTVTMTCAFGRAWDREKPNFDPSKVVAVFLYTARSKGAVSLQLSDLRAVGEPRQAGAGGAAEAPPERDGPMVLADFGADDFDLSRVRPGDAEVSLVDDDAGKALRINLGTKSQYPGASLYSPGTAWDLRGFKGVQVELTNESDQAYRVAVRVDNHGANGKTNCNTEALRIGPHQRQTITVTFGRSWGNPAFALDQSKVIAVLIFGGKNKQPVDLTVHDVRAVIELPKVSPKDAPPTKPVIERVTTTYPATIDIEAAKPMFLFNGGELTAEAGEVISGKESLLGDSRGKDRKYFEFATSSPGLFKPGFEYTVTFRYRVLYAGDGAKFYALFRSLDQGWGRWDRGWTNQEAIVTAPETVHEGSVTGGLTTLDDYQLMFGIFGDARVAIDEVTIVQGKPYAEPDPEHEKIKAIPADAEMVLSLNFEEKNPNHVSIKHTDRLIAGGQAIEGTSLLLDSMGSRGDWNGQMYVQPSLLTGGYRYFAYLRTRPLAWNDRGANAYIVVKRANTKEESRDIVWKRWRGMDGKEAWVYTSFNLPEGQTANLEVGLHKRGKVIIDELVIQRVVLPPQAIDTHVPFTRTDENLIWRDEFDGKTLDKTRWKVSHEPRRGGWWHRDDAYLDGEGSLVLRFRQLDDTFAMGSINTEGIFTLKYGYVEARMKLPTQTGHWPGIWLMGKSVNQVGNDGRDGTEIDIVECPWQDKDVASHALHWDGYGIDHQSTGKKVKVPGLHEGWHTFGVDWSPAGYIFYIDGEETWRTNSGGVCENPLNIILSDEMGGWSGNPRKATNLPDYTLIDYVRVWQEKPAK